MEQLDPKAVWLFFISWVTASIFLLFIIGFFLLPLFLIDVSDNPGATFEIGMAAFGRYINPVLLILVVIGGFYARLSWKYYRYEIAPEGFKKESGIIWKHYVTIPYDRIQNVDVIRGLFARMLDLSDLQIQTAGMSGVAGSEGRLPGLTKEKAEKIRNELIKRVGKKNG